MSCRALTLAGLAARYKTRAMIPCQDLLLATLGRAAPGSLLQTGIRSFSRHLVGGYPYVVKLDLTDACNLRCRMCYAPNRGRELPLPRILSILEQIGDVPVRLDLLGGEPLLRGDIPEIIRFARSRTGIGKTVLYTNATLATEGLARRLYRAGLDRAIVTLISHDPEKHDRFSGKPGSWQETMTGIRNLVNAGIKTYTFTAIHSENVGHISEIRHLVQKGLGITPLFYQYVPQSAHDPLMISRELWHEVKHAILSCWSPEHFRYIARILTFCGRICLGGYYVISVKIDGSVTPCPFIDDICLGKVFDDTIWDIFARRYRSAEFCEFMTLPQACRSCSYKDLCGGGCRAGNRVLFGSYAERDCRCLGPWSEPVLSSMLFDRLPTFF
ncbi:MAG: radical SAM protein [bacterium]